MGKLSELPAAEPTLAPSRKVRNPAYELATGSIDATSITLTDAILTPQPKCTNNSRSPLSESRQIGRPGLERPDQLVIQTRIEHTLDE